MYKQFKVDVIGHKGEVSEITVSRHAISYYRAYTETTDQVGGKDSLISMLYLNGSIKAHKCNCSCNELEEIIKNAE